MTVHTAGLRFLVAVSLALMAAPLLASPLTAPAAAELTAQRVPVLVSGTAHGTSVVTRQEIEERRRVSMVDLLQQVSRLQVEQAGSPGGAAPVCIRSGERPARTKADRGNPRRGLHDILKRLA